MDISRAFVFSEAMQERLGHPRQTRRASWDQLQSGCGKCGFSVSSEGFGSRLWLQQCLLVWQLIPERAIDSASYYC